MESKYKEILLLSGLDRITKEELKRFKFFAEDEFAIPKSELQDADKIDLADLMIKCVGAKSAVEKSIDIFRKMNYMMLAKLLQNEKEKVEGEHVTTTEEKRTQKVEERSQDENCPIASAISRDKQSATKVCPQDKVTSLGTPPGQQAGSTSFSGGDPSVVGFQESDEILNQMFRLSRKRQSPLGSHTKETLKAMVEHDPNLVFYKKTFMSFINQL